MTRGWSQFNLDHYPEGYITDYQPHAERNSKDVRNTDIELTHLPDIATITFSIEFINLTASRNQKFTLTTRKSDIICINESISNHVQTVQIKYRVDKYLKLVYEQREPHMVGEYVRIKYKG